MDVNNLKIVAFIRCSSLPNSVGPWIMDIRFEEGESKTEESWAGDSKMDCVEALGVLTKAKVLGKYLPIQT